MVLRPMPRRCAASIRRPWVAASAVRINRVGSAGTQGSTWVRDVTIVPGLASLDDVAERL